MEVHAPSQSLILKLRDPERVMQYLPKARVVPLDGVNYTQVKFDMDSARVLRNLGIKAPSPIRYFYDWPLRIPGVAAPQPFAHQITSSEFFTLNNRCINLSDMGCVDATTEYLSPTGWKRIDQYEGGEVAQWLPETQQYEFVAPTEYVKKPCHAMIHWKTPFTDQLLSPEHRVLLYRSDGSHVVIQAVQLAVQAAAQDRDLWLHDGEMLIPAFPLYGSTVTYEPSPDGFKYCFVVPSTFLLLRRNGRIFGTGNTGKTKSAAWAADYLMRQCIIRKAIIVCPKSTMDSVWADEFEGNFLGRRKAVVLSGSRERRLKLLAQDADFYIINHDGLKVIANELAKRTDINLWIYDEASAVRNPSSERHKLFAKLIRPTDWMWLMTGTPCPREPTDVWGLAKLLGSRNIPKFFSAFRNDLMIQITQFKWVPKPDAFEKAFAALTPSIRFKKSDCLDLPPITFTTLMAEMSSEQKHAYETMKKELVAEVNGVHITAAHAATKLQKLCQISCIEYTTPVLTARGWVPICEVAPTDLVWDGVEWVAQQGAVYRGYKEVVTVDGVRMTEDHRVLTESGWAEAKDILDGQESEGFKRVSVRLPDGVAPPRVNRGYDEMRDVAMSLRLWKRSGAEKPELTVRPKAERESLRMSMGRVEQNTRANAHKAIPHMAGYARPLRRPEEQRLAKLRCAGGHCVSTVVNIVRDVLVRHARWIRATFNLGADKQRWSVQRTELPLGDHDATGQQQEIKSCDRNTGWPHDSIQCGQALRAEADNAVSPPGCGLDSGSRDCAPVFDLINCGPRRRFVTQGAQGQTMIVHNCGTIYDEYGDAHYLDASDRLKVCDELIDEASDKVIVFVPYTKALDMVAAHLRKNHTVEVVDGRTSGAERKRIFAAFQNEDEPRILVAHPATTAHGLTLTRADLTVWYGPIMDLETFEQANNRMDRPGQKNAMTVGCIAANALELELYSMLKNKQTMQNTVLALFKSELGLPNS